MQKGKTTNIEQLLKLDVRDEVLGSARSKRSSRSRRSVSVSHRSSVSINRELMSNRGSK